MVIARLRASLFLLTACSVVGFVSGCAAGWGDARPAFNPAHSLTVIQGQAATFTVSGEGTGPFTYQWFLNGQPISGATSNSYTIASTTAGDNGDSFTVIVTNAAGTVTAGPYTLTVLIPPAITQQPVNQTVTAGQQATFSVSVVSAATTPLNYQWAQNGTAISGATTATFTTAATSIGDSGATYSVKVSNTAGSVTSSAATLTVNPIVPTLTFAAIPSEIYGNPPFTVSASSASSGAITYSVVSGPATISGNTLTITGVGSVVLQATQAAAGNYAAATATTNFTVGTEIPTLIFASIPAQTYGNPPFTVSASSASSGAVTYSVVSGAATISGNTVTITGVGDVVLQASQAASGDYASATATTNFTVAVEAPTLTFASIPPQTYGNPPFTVSASSASSGAITYSVVSGPATISGNAVTITGVGAVVVEASQVASGDYASATVTTNFTVAAEVPALTFATIPSMDYVDGNPPFTVSASSASSGAITYSVVSGPATISGDTITITGAGPVVLEASQAASGNFAATTTTISFTAVYSTPLATSLVGSTTSPAYGAAINLVPTFSGGTAKIGSSGPGSSDITTSATSGSSYASAAVTSATAYTLTVTGTGGNTATATFTATPTAVSITPISPANQTSAPGLLTFIATASGGATNLLTWSATGGSIDSSGDWTSPSTVGTYTITASSVDNPSVSASTTATVSGPVITAQPVGKNACAGYSASLNVAADYATSYEWLKGGSSVGSGPTLTFTNLAVGDSGSYNAVVSNGAGNVTSNTAILNVVSPTTLTITRNPASVSVYASQTATFSVAATGTGTLAYQWYTGAPGSGTPISGATSSNYTTAALGAADDGTQYYATVTDNDCTDTTLTSTAATLTVSATDSAVPPTIVVQPVGATVTVGGTATFSVTASGPGTLTYRWYRVPYQSTGMSSAAGVAISGATNATYTVPASQTAQTNDGDNYFVVVTNQYGTAVSNHVTLAVGAGIVMQITDQPQTQSVSPGTLASFSAAATCTGCTPAYQWYWIAPGSSSAVALTDGSISSGALSGATIVGSTSSSLNIEDVPSTATGGVFYVTVISTSDGSTQISGTHPITSNSAALFVGSPVVVGNPTAGQGLCNSTTNWVLNGTSPGTTSGHVPYQNTSACTIEMTNDGGGEHSSVYWPTLISTANFSVSFTVAISASGTPADGFTMVLADPSQGASTSSIGQLGQGLGANGIPGLVVGFDTYQNGNKLISPGCGACDPTTVPYMAVGSGASAQWENPWYFVNGNLDTQDSTDYPITTYANSTHSYVISVVHGVMTVTMDGYELFTGPVSLPPVAYLGFTASTGGAEEAVTISNLTATVSAP